MRKQPFCFVLEPELISDLRKLSEGTGLPVAGLIRLAIKKYVKEIREEGVISHV